MRRPFQLDRRRRRAADAPHLGPLPGRRTGQPSLGPRAMTSVKRKRRSRAKLAGEGRLKAYPRLPPFPAQTNLAPGRKAAGAFFKGRERQDDDVVKLCAAIENMIRTVDPARRRAVARAFGDYAATFPNNYDWAVSGQAPALLHFLMGAIEMTCQEAPKSWKPNLRHGDNARLLPGLLRPDGGAALTSSQAVFVVCPHEWTLTAHARQRAASVERHQKDAPGRARGASRGRRDEDGRLLSADGGVLRLLLDIRHEEAIGHSFLEMPDHRSLGSRY
jgi:hypothetical protein